MKIQKIEIKGWRSFDNSNGIVLDNLKRINILIGTNNSGKSNIGKYFLLLKSILKNKLLTKKIDMTEEYANFNCIDKEIHNSDTWSWLKEDINSSIIISSKKDTWILGEPHFPVDKTQNIELKIQHDINMKNNYFSVINKDFNVPFIEKKKGKHLVYDLYSYTDYKKGIKHLLDSIKYWQEFYESLVFIDPIRHYERKTNNIVPNFYFEGSEIKRELLEIQVNDKAKWIKFEKKINRWLQELLNENIEFRLEHENFHFRLSRAGELINADFNQVGTGVSQLFMVLSYLYINQEK